MNNYLQYKGYIGSIEFSEKDQRYYGKVQNECSLISYEGPTLMLLAADFYDAVDEFLEECRTAGTPIDD